MCGGGGGFSACNIGRYNSQVKKTNVNDSLDATRKLCVCCFYWLFSFSLEI